MKVDISSHQKWIDEIKAYGYMHCTDEEIIKLSLSYLLQSLRLNENLNRFKWDDSANKIKKLENELKTYKTGNRLLKKTLDEVRGYDSENR